MKYIYITTFFVIFLVLFLPATLSFGIRSIPINIQPDNQKVEKIFAANNIYQEVLVKENNFSGVGVSLKNPNLVNKKDLFLHIYDKNNNLTGQAIVNGSHIQDGRFLRLNFDPIPNSKGNLYKLAFSAPDAGKDDALEIFYSDQKLPESKKLLFNEKEQEGVNLAYVLLRKPISQTEVLSEIYKEWFNKLFQDKVFLTVYFSLFALGMIYFVFT